MSDCICINIELEPYLRQWYIHENGGTVPVVPDKYSVEHRIFDAFLTTLPPNALPDVATPDTVAIRIPEMKARPTRVYNYLPLSARRELKNCIRNRFIIELWNDLHHFGHIGKRRDDLIFAWMECHGIDRTETNWNAIAKIYQRQRSNYLVKRWRQAQKK